MTDDDPMETLVEVAACVVLAIEGLVGFAPEDAAEDLVAAIEAVSPGLLDETRSTFVIEPNFARDAGVYFVRAGDSVKIGTSTNIAARIRSLQTGCPVPLELLAVAKGGQAEEAEFHRRFAQLRKNGEWFRADGQLLRFIDHFVARKETS